MTKSPKQKQKKTFNVFSAPEGKPTFFDTSLGRERKLQRVHLVRAYTEKEAREEVDRQNWDIHVKYGESLYEIISIEQVD